MLAELAFQNMTGYFKNPIAKLSKLRL